MAGYEMVGVGRLYKKQGHHKAVIAGKFGKESPSDL